MKTLLPLMLFISCSIAAQVNLTKGLVAYYPFNGNDKDQSGNNNSPVFNNAKLTTDRFGNKNSAYYFNGENSYIRIKNSKSLTPREISLVAIVKPQGFYMGDCYNNVLIDKGFDDFRTGYYSLRFTAGEYTKGDCDDPSLAHQNFTGIASTNNGCTSKNLYVTLNKWYCVVYTLSEQETRLYVNGRLMSKMKATSSLGENYEDIFLGKKNNARFPYWFNGVMDEIRIYNRAISAEEVTAICNEDKTSTTPVVNCDDDTKPNVKLNFTISDCYTVSFSLKEQHNKELKTINWQFGDGTTSNKQAPEHRYKKYGTYKVRAVVTNKMGCSDTVTKEINIQELQADFVYAEQGEPGTIAFRAKNNKAIYSWNFADGSSLANESVTTHRFSASGEYDIRMMARNNTGCTDTVLKKNAVLLPVIIKEDFIPTDTVNTVVSAPPVSMEKRTRELVRSIPVENDSILISLYDNGIIDGDSITLIYNDKVILSRHLLSGKALSFSLKMEKAEAATNELTMYAENLGSIPPNTALMIINDGNNKHQVNVSSSRSSNGVVSFTIKR
jgi:PKD repeat protein